MQYFNHQIMFTSGIFLHLIFDYIFRFSKNTKLIMIKFYFKNTIFLALSS